jgi:hypothetical protein
MALKMVDTYVIKLAVVKSNSDLKRLLAQGTLQHDGHGASRSCGNNEAVGLHMRRLS